MNQLIQKFYLIKNIISRTLLLPMTFDIIDETIKITTLNTQIVTIIVDNIITHCSITLYNLGKLYLYNQDNLTYLVYHDNCLHNKECDLKIKLW